MQPTHSEHSGTALVRELNRGLEPHAILVKQHTLHIVAVADIDFVVQLVVHG